MARVGTTAGIRVQVPCKPPSVDCGRRQTLLQQVATARGLSIETKALVRWRPYVNGLGSRATSCEIVWTLDSDFKTWPSVKFREKRRAQSESGRGTFRIFRFACGTGIYGPAQTVIRLQLQKHSAACFIEGKLSRIHARGESCHIFRVYSRLFVLYKYVVFPVRS